MVEDYSWMNALSPGVKTCILVLVRNGLLSGEITYSLMDGKDEYDEELVMTKGV